MFNRYFKNDDGLINLVSRLNYYLSSYRRKQLFFLFILIILLSFAEAISLASIVPFIGVFVQPDLFYSNPWLKNFINFFEISNDDQLFLLVTIIFVSLIIISFLIRLISLYLTNKISCFIEADLKSKIFEYNISQPYNYHLTQNSNDIMSSIVQKTTAIAIYLNAFIQILSCLLTVFFILCVLLIIQPFVILAVTIIVILFFSIVTFINKRKIFENSKKISENQDNIVSIFQDSVGYISEIILYSLHDIFVKKFDKSTYQIAKSHTYNKNVQESPRIYLEFITLLGLAIIIFIFKQNNNEIVSSLTILAALGYGTQKVIPLINRIYVCNSSMRAVQALIIDCLTILDSSKKEKNNSINLEKITFNDSIKLKNVNFSFNNDENFILENINLDIKKGSKVGIKGTTGSGKSTLGGIIIGLLEPTKGKLLVDGIEINSQNKLSWYKHISIIPQNIFLNDVSILENIAIGIEDKNKIDLEKVKKVARQAHISDFIESKPNQYEEKVGERGIRLSGGQRQRIGIARALYRDAKVILFDEATNQLDTDTESLIMKSISNLDKDVTVLFIAHRLSTLENCDQIIDLT